MSTTRNVAVIAMALMPMASCSSDNPVPPLELGSSARLMRMAPHDGRLVENEGLSLANRPQVGVGSGGSSSGSDYGYSGGSTDQPIQRSSVAPVSSEPTYSEPEPSYSVASSDNYATGDQTSIDERRGPNAQHTLESQAASLGGGVSRRQPAEQQEDVQPVARSLPDPEPEGQQVAALPAHAKIALAEVSGVGISAASPLANRFGQQAKVRGLSFTTATDETATHVMKGYFSVSERDGKAVVNYVWDISNRQGKRLHRIAGEEPGGGSGTGWDAVTPAAMEAIAERSIDETASFLGQG